MTLCFRKDSASCFKIEDSSLIRLASISLIGVSSAGSGMEGGRTVSLAANTWLSEWLRISWKDVAQTNAHACWAPSKRRAESIQAQKHLKVPWSSQAQPFRWRTTDKEILFRIIDQGFEPVGCSFQRLLKAAPNCH